MIQAELVRIKNLAPDVTTFWFQPERPVRYTAGQFTELYLPHDTMDKHGNKRWFTLSSSPSEELLAITTRFPGKLSSFKRALQSLQPGATVSLADPMGDFVLPKDPGIPLLFIAAGIGSTPMRSMVKWLLDNGEKRKITMLYAAPTRDDVLFLDIFKAYGLDPDLYLSTEDNRLTTSRILQRTEADNLLYISGPEQMVETFRDELIDKGVDRLRIVGDYFPGY